MSLSFLDVISCGFGAVVLLLVLSKMAEPLILERSTDQLRTKIEILREELSSALESKRLLNPTLTDLKDQLAVEQSNIARLQSDLAKIETQYTVSKQRLQVAMLLENQLASAKQDLSQEMRRLLGTDYRRKDNTIGGIPVDSEYIIFVIDTSGSMFNNAWKLVNQKIAETLDVYPKVKGIQVMNDMGSYMFSRYQGKWIPDTQARRNAILQRLQSWNPFSNSSPVEGIDRAIRTFYRADRRISIYVFGDEYTGGSMDAVIETVDSINKEGERGDRRVRIHALGFPVQFAQPPSLQTTGIRFATLMRLLTQNNGGSFVGLSHFKPQ